VHRLETVEAHKGPFDRYFTDDVQFTDAQFMDGQLMDAQLMDMARPG
jgi:hypothetical protein